ncbi:MAG: tRNA 4-thiouridine(8) synthase ThiI [Candidatus Nanoarchaeia archaeon]|nr:tRNA 4-thiouridine(8) synthase ThiI [Candidatus Nanoarchaeia archaeon]
MFLVIIRYGEIALKGNNRYLFERKLMDHIKFKLKKENYIFELKRHYGRITFEINEKSKDEKEDLFNIKEILKRIPGISSFSIGKKYQYNSLDDIRQNVLEILKTNESFLKSENFKVECTRINKKVKFKSTEVEKEVGGDLFNYFNKKVKLKNPNYAVKIELISDYYVLFETNEEGFGGLPIGCEGRGLSLLSGGFDSPIASLLSIKRGVDLDYIHFMSVVEDENKVLEKIDELMKELVKFQKKTRIFLVPFLDVQNYIASNFIQSYRLIFLRRSFLFFANELANQENYQVIVTGDNIGQVSSQTLTNMNLINKISERLVVRPLICFDKLEIINLAKKYGTHDISIKKADDLCSLFNPKNPITKAKNEYLEMEDDVFFNLIKESIKKVKIIEYS